MKLWKVGAVVLGAVVLGGIALIAADSRGWLNRVRPEPDHTTPVTPAS